MSFLLKNGTVVTPDGPFTGDLLTQGERIAAVGRDLACPRGTQ